MTTAVKPPTDMPWDASRVNSHGGMFRRNRLDLGVTVLSAMKFFS